MATFCECMMVPTKVLKALGETSTFQSARAKVLIEDTCLFGLPEILTVANMALLSLMLMVLERSRGRGAGLKHSEHSEAPADLQVAQ